ncbi:MAG TPA: HAD hydrolase family protein [Stenotrophomonas sp.]|jgi:3-deoxy-D-manno-octulosonate 8-phosphate phosphatase (KDO 8-P phosphatase)
MPYAPLQDLPQDVVARAARIRLACFDVDGTLTDGRLFYDHAGNESKAFSVLDGQGMKQLQRAGIEVAMITARASLSAEQRGRDLGIEVQIGVGHKGQALRALCERHGLTTDEVAFMGDDLPDLSALAIAGLAVAPANAHPWTAERVHWMTKARGGDGAVRELCDVLLAAQDQIEPLLRRALA